MTTIQSPLELKILLGFHLENPPGCVDSAAGRDAIERFFNLGVLEGCGEIREARLTPLGRAWVKAILNTPLPRMCFVDQQGKEIE